MSFFTFSSTIPETKRTTSQLQAHSPNFPIQSNQASSLCIAVIGATGELARRKIFQALFALYYSGFLPENAGIVSYSRKNLIDEDLRSITASVLSCRIDHLYGSHAAIQIQVPAIQFLILSP
ncbi:hypothetical protein KPL70_016986 [Citrus sinensis]|uniref:inactive glucose-6-phosphate 1-dehydrogenase 4, chloroplastic-like isoform X1 n=1 Tax=Citrus sinensis TaxID=2711 RepID=UPI000D6244CD|nr:inactive glucose-6-phosphate 1-dehydrogenase 4, chloroplastic-like isoform X1 [Citrus sinensis]KAH9670426.1 hypothetical protein KPL70_016986 [Citrus sinensis]